MRALRRRRRRLQCQSWRRARRPVHEEGAGVAVGQARLVRSTRVTDDHEVPRLVVEGAPPRAVMALRAQVASSSTVESAPKATPKSPRSPPSGAATISSRRCSTGSKPHASDSDPRPAARVAFASPLPSPSRGRSKGLAAATSTVRRARRRPGGQEHAGRLARSGPARSKAHDEGDAHGEDGDHPEPQEAGPEDVRSDLQGDAGGR